MFFIFPESRLVIILRSVNIWFSHLICTVADSCALKLSFKESVIPGAIISSIGLSPMIWDNFSIFRTNCAIVCGPRAYMLRGFVAQGKWRPKFPKSFILLAHYSTRVCLLEFCLSICSSLSEVRQCRILVCPALCHWTGCVLLLLLRELNIIPL